MDIKNSKSWTDFDLFNQVPSTIAVIDRKYNIVNANKNFVETFGPWEGKKCYEVYKKRKRRCGNCRASKTFLDGEIRESEEEGLDLKGNLNNYLVHIAPYRNPGGSITHIIEMSTDITQRVRIQAKYATLFDNFPCYITVIDREFNIIKSNDYFRKKFGNAIGTACYKTYKKRDTVCDECTAKTVFNNGRTYRSLQEGYDLKGNKIYYMVTASPYPKNSKNVEFVIEMANDVTKTITLEKKLNEMLEFQEIIIQNAIDGIIASNNEGTINIYNPSAKKLLKFAKTKIIGKVSERDIFPDDFLNKVQKNSEIVMQESNIKDKKGNLIPIAYSGTKLMKGDKDIGKVMFFHDLSEIKQLEKGILDAERLAAVGQTVAGLAHGIKNILMGLEGGMYVVNSGFSRGDNKMVSQGWDMLTNNIDKITSFTKEFLGFARGTTIEVKYIKPYEIALDTIGLFKIAIENKGIKLVTDIDKNLQEAPMDSNEIHTCLANLVSNAIDACTMSDAENPQIDFKLYEKNNTIYYEVSDNGVGIDYEIKKRIFTSFFSTKDSGRGTGLGLLTTRKIVTAHGGKALFESKVGRGSMFRLQFPKNRLPVTQEEVNI